MTGTPRLVLELSLPRCGTTSLMRLMRGFAHVATYGEVFHPTEFWVTGPEARAVFGAEMPPEALHDRLRADPVWGLERILGHAAGLGRRYAEFKLFPHHLRTGQIERVVARFRPVGFVMHRAPVDIYISHKKQTVTGAWEGVSTSHIRPELDAREFLRWRWRQQYHLQMGRRILERAGVPIVILSYEELYGPGAAPPEETLAAAFRAAGVELGPFDPGVERLRRQDETADRARKVLNWEAFSGAVERASGRDALERFDVMGRRAVVDILRLMETSVPRGLIRNASRLLRVSAVPVAAPARVEGEAPRRD